MFRKSSYCSSAGCVQVGWTQVGWTRSSHCSSASCVQVGWTKSSACHDGSCVEVFHQRGMIFVRDSKDTDQPYLMWSPQVWETEVCGRIIAGNLPPGATGGDGSAWDGGPVRWLNLDFTADEWDTFVQGVKDGEFTVEALRG